MVTTSPLAILPKAPEVNVIEFIPDKLCTIPPLTLNVYVAEAEKGVIVKVIGSPAQIILSGSALLDSEGTAGVNTPISSEVLTLFDKSGSSGIVIPVSYTHLRAHET